MVLMEIFISRKIRGKLETIARPILGIFLANVLVLGFYAELFYEKEVLPRSIRIERKEILRSIYTTY
jgi:hypothetical protein